MCGIAGYVCKDEYDKSLDTIFPLMGVFMDTRGGQAWGYTDGTRIHKDTGELQEGWTPEFSGAKQAAIHTRYGTVGQNTKENAHPWDFGDGFIGMHNGVVDNHFELNARYDRRCAVDSENLLLHIKEGRDLQEVHAYGTVVFWRDGVLHLGCFNGGDLDVAQTAWGVVFASRDWAIRNAFKMAGAPEPEYFYRIDEGKMYFVKDGELYLSSEKLNVGIRTEKKRWDEFCVINGQVTNTNPAQSTASAPAHERVGSGDCEWCTTNVKDLYASKHGMLCDGCFRFASEDDEQDDRDFSALEAIEDDADDDEDYFSDKYERMTVREYCENNEIGALPFDMPLMTECDECTVTLVADDECFVERFNRIDFVLCGRCYVASHNVVEKDATKEQQIPTFIN